MFPQELFDEIADWLFDDHPSLMALSCTSQCLRARSQALLFHELVLSPNTNSPSSYIPLLEMSPHILTYVRRLRIFAGDYSASSSPRKRRFVHQDNSLGRLIRAVPNVDAIELMKMFGLEAFTTIGSLLPIIASPTVCTLSLRTIFLPTPQSLFTLLSYFPSLSSLRLHSVHAIGMASPSLNAGNILLTEISISTGIISSPLGVSLFKSAASEWSSHLRSLIIESYSARDLFIISRVIPQLPNLVTLTFKRPMGDISHPDTQQRLAAEIPVFPLPKLRSLHLSLPGFTVSSWARWWLSHLTQAAAVSLEYLAVDLQYVDAPEMQHSVAAWKEVEIALMQLPKLKSVNMRMVEMKDTYE
ncbi:hypothetical protein CPB85DRAFT_102934 [Mucidula mucida]|nr:hypothetical protein CPB85DRAFT_102934 [Mucidula mucida]